jgi:Putative oxidoreductase C terminal domain
VVRGSLARLEILQGAEQKWLPELYVTANAPGDAGRLKAALERRVAALAAVRPGLAVADEGARLRVVVPDRYRTTHEAHFAEVTERFLGYLRDPASQPKWENANMLAKYRITTEAMELSRR